MPGLQNHCQLMLDGSPQRDIVYHLSPAIDQLSLSKKQNVVLNPIALCLQPEVEHKVGLFWGVAGEAIGAQPAGAVFGVHRGLF